MVNWKIKKHLAAVALISMIIGFEVWATTNVTSQVMIEICDNGIDDDGDGLVDLNDVDDCTCVSVSVLEHNVIPNPSFEDQLCCPDSHSMVHCAEHWQQATGGTSDYFTVNPLCDSFIVSDGGYVDIPPLPVPDGFSFMGFVSQSFQIDPMTTLYALELIGSCTLETLPKDSNFRIEFDIGLGEHGSATFLNDSMTVAIYGSSDCGALPLDPTHITCPVGVDDWVELGRTTVTGMNEWVPTSINFVAPMDINAFMIGGVCDYEDLTKFTFIDNLRLNLESEFDTNSTMVEIGVIDSCGGISMLTLSDDSDFGDSYQWYRDGVAIIGAVDSTYTIEDTMAANYQLRVSNDSACALSDIYPYVYDPDAVITFMIDTTICEGDTIQFDGMVYHQEGTYDWTMPSSIGCDSTVVLTIEVVALGSIEIVEDDTISCFAASDGALTINPSPPSTATIQWSSGHTTLRADSLGAGLYTVVVEYESGCTAMDTFELVEPVMMTLSTSTTDAPCGDEGGLGSLTIDQVNGGVSPYRYELDGDTISVTIGEAIDSLASGMHTLVVTDANGCAVSTDFEILTTGGMGTLTLDASAVEVDLGAEVTLTATLTGASEPYTITWTGFDPMCSDCLEQVVVPIEGSNLYTVRIEDADGCTYIDELEINASLFINTDVYVPSAFSPNNDGINEVFTFYPIEHVREVVSFQVFNRWGGLVYGQYALDPSETLVGWNGLIDGERASEAMYVYLLRYEDAAGARREMAGEVLLVR